MSYLKWTDVHDEVLKKHDEDYLTAWKRDYKGVLSVPPAIEVGDKVRVCKARWVAEGCHMAEQRYLKEGTVVSIKRTLGGYSDRNETFYEVYFEPGHTIFNRRIHWYNSVTLRVSYKEIYSHKPKGANFTYMLNRNSSPIVPETEILEEKFRNLLETSEKFRIQIEAMKKYSDAMYKKLALLGHDIAVTTVDESPFIYPDMDIASWYPNSMAHLRDESNIIGKVNKMEADEYGVKIYISQPPRCGKNLFEEIRKMADRNLGFEFKSFLKKHPIIPDEIKTIKNGDTTMKTVDLRVTNIIHNGPCTIVFWMDNTKTIVKLKPGDTYDPHAAFCIAVAKKMYGNNSKISKIVDQFSKDVSVPEMPSRNLTIEELKAAADKLGYRVARKPKKK